jgi:sulfite oxidase
VRSDDLIYHGTKPCNAETPAWVHADNYITPNELFYVRHHSPVPEPDMSKYRLEVEGQGIPVPASLTLEQIKALPKREVTVTIQCAGNRRSHFESVKKTQVVESSPVKTLNPKP